MTYRAEQDALREKADAAERRAADAERRARDAEQELARVAAGEPAVAKLRGDMRFTALLGLLGVQAAGYLLFALAAFPGYIAIAHEDLRDTGLPPTLQGVLMACVVDAFFAPVGVGSLVGAIGLHRGRRWGYTAALIASGLSLLCGCMPVGVFGLYLLLQPDVRGAFYPRR